MPTWLPPQLPANVPTFVAIANGASTSVPTTATPTWLPPAGGRATAPSTSAAAAEPAAAHDLAGAIETLAATDARHFLYTPELSLMAEIDSTAVAYEYLWFAGQPAVQHETATGALNYYFNDHLGTPILTTNASGVVNWRVEREPYGAIHTTRTGTGRHQPLAFPGQEEHAGSELAYNIFRWYRNGWGRYSQADPLGVGGAGIMLPGQNTLTRWSQNDLERMRARGFSGATAMTGYAYADDTPLRATDPLGLFLWHCIAKALTSSSTSFPIDPTDFKKGLKKACTYAVECEAKDSLFALPIKIEGFWQRPMPPNPCPCDKYCTFSVFGVPQTYLGQNLFQPVGGVYCSNLSPNSI